MIEQFDLLQEEAELISAIREMTEELQWFNKEWAGNRVARDVFLIINARRQTLRYKIEEKFKAIYKIRKKFRKLMKENGKS